jgi:hypothetical protein
VGACLMEFTLRGCGDEPALPGSHSYTIRHEKIVRSADFGKCPNHSKRLSRRVARTTVEKCSGPIRHFVFLLTLPIVAVSTWDLPGNKRSPSPTPERTKQRPRGVERRIRAPGEARSSRDRQGSTPVMDSPHRVTVNVERAIGSQFDGCRPDLFSISAGGDDHRGPTRLSRRRSLRTEEPSRKHNYYQAAGLANGTSHGVSDSEKYSFHQGLPDGAAAKSHKAVDAT